MCASKPPRHRRPPRAEPSQVQLDHPPLCAPHQMDIVYDMGDPKHVSYDLLLSKQEIFRGSWLNMSARLNDVMKDNPIASDLLHASGWMDLMQIKFKLSSQLLTKCLVERWWDMTHTFQLPGFEIGITPMDFIFPTGIPIGNGPVPPFGGSAYKETWGVIRNKYFSALPVCSKELKEPCKSGGIKVSVLSKMIHDWPKYDATVRADVNAQRHIYRAFVLWMIGNVFFANGTSIVRFGWLKLFDASSKELEHYDWGSAILGRIYHCLDVCSMNTEEMSFEGMWMILEHWFYMYFKRCEPVLRLDSDPVPRLHLWEASNIGGKVNNAPVGRRQLEIRTSDVTQWDVIRTSQHDLRSDMLEATAVSRTRRLLWDSETRAGFWYLGDRCWRQATSEIGIPANPPAREYMLGVDWNVYERCKAEGWPDAEQWVLPCTPKEYRSYWKRVSRGHIEPLVYSQQGIDHIGGSSIPCPDVYIHSAPSGDIGHDPMDYTQHATQPDAPYQRWRALCMKTDLSGFEYVEIPQSTEDDDRDIQMEAHVERTGEEWKHMYLDILKALKASHILHNNRLYEAMSRRNDTGAPDSQPHYSGHASPSHW